MLYEFLDTLVEAIGDWLWLLVRWLMAGAFLAAVSVGAFYGWRGIFRCLTQAVCP